MTSEAAIRFEVTDMLGIDIIGDFHLWKSIQPEFILNTGNGIDQQILIISIEIVVF